MGFEITVDSPEHEIQMRPRRSYITTLADVTINRSGESAVITYRDRPSARWCSPPDGIGQDFSGRTSAHCATPAHLAGAIGCANPDQRHLWEARWRHRLTARPQPLQRRANERHPTLDPPRHSPYFPVMNRRQFLLTTLAGLLAAPLAAQAQPASRTARVGFITPSARLSFASGERRVYREAFTGQLRELGWTEGQNLVIESRYAEGYYERLPALAAELVRLPIDVVFANSAPAALAAKRATTTLPIVFETLGDPISAGLVSSLARPGGNLTGISGLGPELSGKRLELLRELVPGLRRVMVVVNPRNVMANPTIHEAQKAAGLLGLRVHVVEVREPDQLESALGGVARDGATAVIVVPDPMLLSHARRIQALLLKNRLPAVHAETGWATPAP